MYVQAHTTSIHSSIHPSLFFFFSFIPWLGVGVRVGVGMDGWNTVGDAVLVCTIWNGMEWNECGGWMECWD